tara:strand:- start:191 stop:904 length:714 start_codon:yes stop_codon:yes gene_type:complete
MNELALFAGIGGGILGGSILGWDTVCAVERNEYAASVLIHRQNEGHLEPFPVWCDVRTFEGEPWKGSVDVVSGGFPCQDISIAGRAGGINAKKSGLWKEMARIVCEVRPRYVFVENSPTLVGRGLGVVLGDLAKMGFDAAWGVFGAWEVGAPHKRDRLWIVAAHPCGRRYDSPPEKIRAGGAASFVCDWWQSQSRICRVDDRGSRRVDRLRAVGNAQVPAVAAYAWNVLREKLEGEQ